MTKIKGEFAVTARPAFASFIHSAKYTDCIYLVVSQPRKIPDKEESEEKQALTNCVTEKRSPRTQLTAANFRTVKMPFGAE